jgi:hypothetical protein
MESVSILLFQASSSDMLVATYQNVHFRGTYTGSVPEDGGSGFLRDVVSLLPDYSVS